MGCCKCINMKKAEWRSSMKSYFHDFVGSALLIGV